MKCFRFETVRLETYCTLGKAVGQALGRLSDVYLERVSFFTLFNGELNKTAFTLGVLFSTTTERFTCKSHGKRTRV